MAREAAPAFQLYVKEFLTDGNVAAMSLQERGAYITLICLCWQEQSLPAESARLANMVGLPLRMWKRLEPAVRGCFREVDGRLVHPRLERERAKQAEFRARQTAAARARWGDATAVPDGMPESSRNDAESMPETCSPISDLRTTYNPPIVPPHAGGRITRAERKEAERIRALNFGCVHDRRCETAAACIELLVQGMRQRRTA